MDLESLIPFEFPMLITGISIISNLYIQSNHFLTRITNSEYLIEKMPHNVSAAEPVLMGVDACYGSVALLVGCFIFFLQLLYH